MAIESSEANEYRSKCLRRIYLAELVSEYLETRASAEDMVHSMNVRSGSQPNRRKVIEEVMGRPGKGLPRAVAYTSVISMERPSERL